MTMRYAHLAPSHKQKTVEVLEEALHNNSTVQFGRFAIKRGYSECRNPLILLGGGQRDRSPLVAILAPRFEPATLSRVINA